MPTPRHPGMDHDLYPYSPLIERPDFKLPDGKPVALIIVLHIEHWELFQPEGAYRDPRFKGNFPAFDPDYRAWSYHAYGNRVGLWRILDLLDRLDLPVTAAVGAGAIEAHPEIVDAVAARNYEVVAHGLTVNRIITSLMSEDEERAHIAVSRQAICDAFCVDPKGWLGQDFGTSPRTPRLLVEAGFAYTLDWANDEQPYEQLGGRLLALPSPSEWDDAQTIAARKVPVDRFPGLVADGLDELARSGADSARVMTLGIHPWIFGAPHRFRYLCRTLEALHGRDDVRVTTAGDLADIYRRQS